MNLYLDFILQVSLPKNLKQRVGNQVIPPPNSGGPRKQSLDFDYYVMTQTCAKEGKWRAGSTVEWVSPLRATPKQKPAAIRESSCLSLISAVRGYGLVHSAHTQKLSSAHVLSHCNRALLVWLIKRCGVVGCELLCWGLRCTQNHLGNEAFCHCLQVLPRMWVDSKGFWQWCATPRITVFEGLLPASGILKTREHKVSETGSVSVFRWWGEAVFHSFSHCLWRTVPKQ
jgi:hypothetical protein